MDESELAKGPAVDDDAELVTEAIPPSPRDAKVAVVSFTHHTSCGGIEDTFGLDLSGTRLGRLAI